MMTQFKNELYNNDVKNRYLETIKNENSRTTYYYNLLQAAPIEEIEGKDLYNFSLSQIAEVIKNKQPHRVEVVRSQASTLKLYIDWAIEHGYRDNVINPLDGVDEIWYESLVDKERKVLFTANEIEEDIVGRTVNPQDKAMIQLMFEGVWGEKLSELSNLKMEHVNFDTNEITLFDDKDNRERTIKVSDKAIQLIKDADAQRIYFYENGQRVSKRKDFSEKELDNHGYVFKNTVDARSEEIEKVNSYTFYQRLGILRDVFNLEILTPNSIRKSGQLKLAHDLYLEYGEIKKKQIDIIGEQYGLRKIKVNGRYYYNKTALKEVTSADSLMKYYGINIEE